MSKNYLAYTLLVFAAFCWSGNFIVGKYAYLFEVPPLTLNFLRWVSVWLILIPFTYKEIYKNLNYIKKNENLDMPNLFQRLKEKNLKTIVYPIHEPWLDLSLIHI